MALVKYLARDFVFELNTGTVAVPVWTPIGGLVTWSPTTEKEDVDDTTFDNDGIKAHKVVSRGAGLTLEGFYIVDNVTGARDPGQDALITLAGAIGYDSTKQLRITEPAGKTVMSVSADVNHGGGDKNANSAFTATLTRSGAAVFTPGP